MRIGTSLMVVCADGLLSPVLTGTWLRCCSDFIQPILARSRAGSNRLVTGWFEDLARSQCDRRPMFLAVVTLCPDHGSSKYK